MRKDAAAVAQIMQAAGLADFLAQPSGAVFIAGVGAKHIVPHFYGGVGAAVGIGYLAALAIGRGKGKAVCIGCGLPQQQRGHIAGGDKHAVGG